MSARKAIVPTLVLASLAAAAFFAFARSGPRAAALRVERSSDPERAGSAATADESDEDEVRRLRAEVKAKDGVIRALTKQAVTSDADRAAETAATVAALKRTALSRAVEALDARLAAAPADPAAKAELEQALRPALESKTLGAARVDEVRCSGSLCKIALSADSGAELAPALQAVADHVPKTFPAVIAYPGQDEGEREIFVGRSSDALTVAPAP